MPFAVLRPAPLAAACFAAVALALVAPLPAAFAGDHAASDDEPLVLTLEDLDRVNGRGAAKGAATASSANDDDARAGDAEAAGEDRSHADEARAVAKSKPGRAPGREAESWHEEYFRLKALALRQALERGEPVHFGDEGLGVAADPRDREPEPAAVNAVPACVYDQDGKLIHAPTGAGCRAERRSGDRPAAADGGVCIRGLNGEILHAPPGRDCDVR